MFLPIMDFLIDIKIQCIHLSLFLISDITLDCSILSNSRYSTHGQVAHILREHYNLLFQVQSFENFFAMQNNEWLLAITSTRLS